MSFNRYNNPAPQFQGPQSRGPQFDAVADWVSKNPTATGQQAMQQFSPNRFTGSLWQGGLTGAGAQPNGFGNYQQAMAMSLLARGQPQQQPQQPQYQPPQGQMVNAQGQLVPLQGSYGTGGPVIPSQATQMPMQAQQQPQVPAYNGGNFNQVFGPGNYLSFLYALMGGLRGQGY